MDDEEVVGSPWDGDTPNYKHVPPVNPKTNEPVKLYLCDLCGGAVLNRKIHSAAHREHRLPGSGV